MTTNESEILEKRLTNVINMVKESETSRKDPGSGTALVLELMSDVTCDMLVFVFFSKLNVTK